MTTNSILHPHLFRYLLCAICATALLGCTITNNSTKMNRLSVGMSKSDTIAALGTPQSTSANGPLEVLRYDFYPPPPYLEATQQKRYFVKLVNGRVESYGEMGDFDSTKDPTLRILYR